MASLVRGHRLRSWRACVYLLHDTQYLPGSGIEPESPALQRQTLNHRTTREAAVLNLQTRGAPRPPSCLPEWQDGPHQLPRLAPSPHRACGGRVSWRGNAGFFSTTHEGGVQHTSMALAEGATRARQNEGDGSTQRDDPGSEEAKPAAALVFNSALMSQVTDFPGRSVPSGVQLIRLEG